MTIFFYKAHGPYGCFSNFSPHSIYLQGKTWPTSEHYYQAQKFVGTTSPERCHLIWQAPTPEAAATLGRDPRYPVRQDWDEVKSTVMYAAVWAKFSSHLEIQAILLGTGNAEIVEDSPTDTYWGCGRDRQGENHLGKILMQVRQQLRS
jgi:ribA/ribD-fused uncharacterized protein